jgi:cystathionine beta-lyase
MKFNTKAIHGGQHPDQAQAVMPPIYQTTTYAQTSPGHPMGNMNTVELQTPHEQL